MALKAEEVAVADMPTSNMKRAQAGATLQSVVCDRNAAKAKK